MMPMLSGRGSMTWACIDANAVIDYVRERTLYDLGEEPTGRKADAMRRCMDQLPRVFVAETAARESEQNIFNDLKQKLGRRAAARLKRPARKLLDKYLERTRRKDKLEHVAAAREMYASIRCDSSNQKFANWRKKKKDGTQVRPVLGSDINDLKILSTAAYYVKKHPVEFWTHDMDFTIFVDEIATMFGLKVVDTYRLAKRLSHLEDDAGG